MTDWRNGTIVRENKQGECIIFDDFTSPSLRHSTKQSYLRTQLMWTLSQLSRRAIATSLS